MVGSPVKAARINDLKAENDALRVEVRTLRARLKHDDYEVEVARELTEQTRDTLIREMLACADEGLSLEEIAAAWNVTLETLKEWADADVAFGVAAARARTRARAATMGALRKLMEAGRGVPGAFADRIMNVHSDSLGDVAGADALIRVDLTDDLRSCPQCGYLDGAHEFRPSDDGSDGG